MKAWLLHLVDHATRYSASVAIKSKRVVIVESCLEFGSRFLDMHRNSLWTLEENSIMSNLETSVKIMTPG